ncbi:hypothetical protein GCM10022206_62290 [Streptomyces chiangmaiensis]
MGRSFIYEHPEYAGVVNDNRPGVRTPRWRLGGADMVRTAARLPFPCHGGAQTFSG